MITDACKCTIRSHLSNKITEVVVYITFRRRNICANIYTRTFKHQEGQLQQISVFAFSLILKKHCKLE